MCNILNLNVKIIAYRMLYFITNYYKTEDINYNMIYYNNDDLYSDYMFLYKSKNKKLIKRLIKNKEYNFFTDKKKSKCAYKHGCPWSEHTSTNIIKNNNLKCFKYVHKHNCPWNEMTSNIAAYNNNLKYLKYIYENGGSWSSWVYCNAALKNNLKALKYIHSRKRTKELHEWTCIYAVMGNSLECLEYAHKHDCPYDKKRILNIKNINDEVKKYIEEEM